MTQIYDPIHTKYFSAIVIKPKIVGSQPESCRCKCNLYFESTLVSKSHTG